jgi:hypothetical protein
MMKSLLQLRTFIMKKHIIALAFIATVAPSLLGFLPRVQAATQRSADFTPGNTVGIGLFGLSYDYGLGPVSLGFDSNARLNSALSMYGGGGGFGGNTLKFSTRGLWKVMETEKITGAFIVAAHYDPGDIGRNNAAFVPEVGFSMAYRILDTPFLIRLNTTVGYNSTLKGTVYPDYSAGPSDMPTEPTEVDANFLQKFGVGPGTSFELAYQPDENSEITLGGGSLVGMRLKF